MVPCDADQGISDAKAAQMRGLGRSAHPGVKPLCNVVRRPIVNVLDGPLGWMHHL